MSGKDFGQAAAPERAAPERAAGLDAERRRAAPPALVADALDAALAARAAQTGRAALDVVDVGAGTGGFAVQLAALGHHVTVVDPSPDALAAARWRAAELGVTLTAVQGEAGDLAALVGEGAADLVVCHNVLEYVDSPAAAMTAIARVLRPGGTVSVLAANVVAAVLQRALAGRYDEARRLLDPRSRRRAAGGTAAAPRRRAGTAGSRSPSSPRSSRAPACGWARRRGSGSSPACCPAPGPTPTPPTRCATWRRRRPATRRCATSPPGCTLSPSGVRTRPRRPAGHDAAA